MSASHARSHVRAIAIVLVTVGALPGCRHGRDYIWVDAVPPAMNTTDTAYRVSPGDVIGVQVFNQPANSVDRIRVRDDGMISLPFLNDVYVAGSDPTELARRLEVKLKTFMTAPVVTVVVHERRPIRVSVLGKVARPGVYDLDPGAGVIHALAAAGGLTPFADDDGVYVLRRGYWADGDPAPARIRFRYRDIASGKGAAALFLLRVADVVVAE